MRERKAKTDMVGKKKVGRKDRKESGRNDKEGQEEVRRS